MKVKDTLRNNVKTPIKRFLAVIVAYVASPFCKIKNVIKIHLLANTGNYAILRYIYVS
jgi:hypothetical protein